MIKKILDIIALIISGAFITGLIIYFIYSLFQLMQYFLLIPIIAFLICWALSKVEV